MIKNGGQQLELPFMAEYYKKHVKYNAVFLSSQMYSIVCRLASQSNYMYQHKKNLFFNTLCSVSREMMLKKLELVMFSLILKQVTLGSSEVPERMFLIHIALMAKRHMSGFVANDALTNYLDATYRGFSEDHDNWVRRHESLISLKPQSFNALFKELCTECKDDTVDYNVYVEEIFYFETCQEVNRNNR